MADGAISDDDRLHLHFALGKAWEDAGQAAPAFTHYAAANAIRFNDVVLLPAGFPRTAEALSRAGYTLREIGNSECAKLDGGMSCLSLRFSPTR